MANEIEIVIKSKDMTGGGFETAERKAGKLSSALKDVGKMAGGFLVASVLEKGAAALTDFLQGGIELATDLNESISKTSAIFDESSGEIEAWADTAAKAMGLSKGKALEAASGFGNLFEQLGFNEDAMGEMSTGITELAADLASFHNADITEVLESQSGAFRGEFDSIQKYLPMLNAATVEQRAYEMTGKKTTQQINEMTKKWDEGKKAAFAQTQELTDQDKALATYQLMLEGAGVAQGDFARTSEGAANAQRIATAEMENAQAKLGEQLIPLQMKWIELQSKLASVLTEEVIPRLIEFKTWLKENEDTVRPLAILIGVVLVGALVALAGGILIVSTPFIALIKLFQFAQPSILSFWIVLNRFWDGFAVRIADNLGRIQAWKDGAIGALLAVGNAVSGLGSRIASAASGMWDSISNGFRTMINKIVGWWNNLSFTLPKINIEGPSVFGKKLPGVNWGGQSFGTPNIGGLASGGTRSGWAMVGERGRELVNLGAGKRVLGNQATEAALGAGGGAGTSIVVHVLGSIRSDKDLVKMLKDAAARGEFGTGFGGAAA